MGEAKRKQSATQKFIAGFPDCYFCGGQRRSTTREHMPPKSLFDNAHRPDKLVMPACDICNRATSTADLTAAIVSRWNYNTYPQSQVDHRKLVGQVRFQAPDLLEEWRSIDKFGAEKARRHLIEHGSQVPADAGLGVIGPLTIRQLNLFAHKAVLALYFEHFRIPLSPQGGVCAFWRSKEDFALEGIPAPILEIMPHYGTLVQGKWDTHETFEYRYEVNREEGLLGCIAKLRHGLFVLGFAVTNVTKLDSDVADWVSPDDPLALLTLQRFQKKN